MRLAVNLRLYVKGEIGGIENYVRQIVRGIARQQQITQSEWTVFGVKSELENIGEFAPGANLFPVTHETAEVTIAHELRRRSFDLLFCPLLVLDPLQRLIPSIITVPDLQHEYLPEFFDKDTLGWRKHTFEPSILQADTVFTISEYSKSTILEKFGVDPDRVVAVGLDVDEEFRLPATSQTVQAFQKLDIPENYIYFPANFWRHKNHTNLLRAMKLLVRDGYADLYLVLTGAPSAEMNRVQSEVLELGLADRVRFLGYQPKAIVVELYRKAKALVFVSQFEGFGIPILEAFHTGTPVVTSRTTSCPEVAGDAAVFVDDWDPPCIAAGIRRIIEDENLRCDLVERGKRRALEYSWSQAIATTLQTFERVVHCNQVPPHVEIREYPVVSIVTPTYNMGRFLEETIQSVLSQDYPHIDYVVMDGGSTDGTLDILRKYDGRLRYRSEPDAGQADAINKGLSLSSGPILAYLNADDTYLPGAVRTAVEHLGANENVAAVYGDAYHVHEDGSLMGPYPTRKYDQAMLSRNCFICQPAAFVRRDAFMRVGGMNSNLHFALDYDLWIRISKEWSLLKIDGHLATSRMYKDNKTVGKRREVYQEICSVVKKHYGFVPYEWVYGYAAYLIDRKDQIFDLSSPSRVKQLAALLLGSYVNSTAMRRYWSEWSRAVGLRGEFDGRWEDGWISRNYSFEFNSSGDSAQILISGRHLAPFDLNLSFILNGLRVKETAIRERGPFVIVLTPTHQIFDQLNRLDIRCDRSFSPIKNGDRRSLSCIIDSIAVGHGKNVSQNVIQSSI
jgi:glycosyltransferase involved in cell wall biosynthesis